AFVMENVGGMVRGRMRGRFRELMLELKRTGYNVKCFAANAMHYGVPQSRTRLFWIGLKDGNPTFPEPSTNMIRMMDVLSDLGNKMNEKKDHYWIDESPEGRNTRTWPLARAAKQGETYAGHQKRMRWNRPALCLMAGDTINKPYLRNHHCHPLYTRTLSALEMKRVATFPDNFKLPEWRAHKLIGNCVPPEFMRRIGEHIKGLIDGF
nr:DNA cytosine methyltransferase [candidate division KSB1 bacterium]NIR71511.1 DNA cytosine methyltransferase [candidate division KSB1 bacterium]NIS27947.1 DNA cytosine methyltransferase [candidate division KSB1 bacterium]NIT74824.1 DNA cytosine methyltransferase [candidate division KSB1 bacterium]NIU28604.1 DNA cytosine methyltransferase [candidate division KSB1 bacterium]